MKRGRYALFAALGAVALLAAGAITVFALGTFSQDRKALAQQTVQTYWTNIAHGKVSQAWAMMTPGNQASRPLKDYTPDMYGFLESTGGVVARVGKPTVNGDFAVVPVTLHSPKSPSDLKAYQHLYWYDGGWRISDPNGGLSRTR